MDKNFIKNVSILSVINIIVRIIGLFYRIPLTNIIGNEGNGYYGSAYNVYTIVLLISSTSIPMAVSKILSSNQFKTEEKSKVFHCMIIYSLLVGILGASICYIFAPILTVGNQNAIPVLKMLAPTIFFSSIIGTFRGYFQSKKNMTPTAISQLVEQMVNAIVSIGASYLLVKVHTNNKTVWGAIGGASGTLLGAIASLIFLIFLFIKKREKETIVSDINTKNIYKVLIFTMFPMILSTLVHNMSTTIDMTLYYNLLQWKGEDYKTLTVLYGIYSGQFLVIFHIPTALVATVSTSVMPLISGEKNKQKKIKAIQNALKITAIIAFPCVIGLMLLNKPILQLLFHQDVVALNFSAKLLFWGSFAIIGTSFTTVSITILQGLNHMKTPIRNIALSVSIQTILNILLFCFTNLNIFVLIVSIISYSILTCIFNFWSLSKEIPIKALIIASIKTPFVASLVMGCYLIVLNFVANLISLRNIVYVTLALIGSIFIYFLILKKRILFTE